MQVRGWVTCDEVGDLDLDRDRFESAGTASERSELPVELELCALKLLGWRMVEGSHQDRALEVVLVLTSGVPRLLKALWAAKSSSWDKSALYLLSTVLEVSLGL